MLLHEVAVLDPQFWTSSQLADSSMWSLVCNEAKSSGLNGFHLGWMSVHNSSLLCWVVCEDVLHMLGALLSWFLGEMHVLHPPRLCLPGYDQQLSSQELFLEVLGSFQGMCVCLDDSSRRRGLLLLAGQCSLVDGNAHLRVLYP